MVTHFILIRHGQTEWNREERFRGHADIPLNETGKTQAQKIAARIAGEKIDVLYASPLQRTLQTAQSIAETHQLEIQKSDALLDLDVGALEGLTVDEARQAFPEVIDKWLNAPGHVKFPKGDSLRAVRTRAEKLLDELAAQHDGQTVALVSHRVVCHVVLCLALDMKLDALWNLKQDNGCINRFDKTEHGYVVTLLNETGHLI
ncbi:MAG: histidine phosphatase family protein [Chloroflexi bacterium]|nr:histidine phosphatase family protein [Chloroflexota bacterium]